MSQLNFKKPFEFHSFSEIFHYGLTRISNTNFDVFIQYNYTTTILRKKNMGQSLFKEHSEFQTFDEIFYCGMTRLSNTNLGVLDMVS